MKASKEDIKKKTITLKALMEKAEREDIEVFVRGYAEKDSKFKLHLKTHFVNVCEINEISPLVNSILNTIVKAIQYKDDKISKSNYRLLLGLLVELLAQAEDKIAVEQYKACFEITYVCLDKIHYVLGAYYQQEEKLLASSNDFHNIITTLLEKDIAPELRIRIYEYIKNLAHKSYYTYSQYSIVNIIKQDKNCPKELIVSISNSIKSKLDVELLASRYKSFLTAYLRTIAIGNIPIDINHIEKHDIDTLRMSYQSLLHQKEYKAVLYSINSFDHKRYHQYYTDIIISAHEGLANRTELKQLLYDAFLKYYDFKYFDILKSINTIAVWKKYNKKIKETLQINNNPSIYAQYLRKEGMFSELVMYLKKINDWELIKNFSFYIYERDKYKLELLYQYHIDMMRKEINTQNHFYDMIRFIDNNNDTVIGMRVRKYIEGF